MTLLATCSAATEHGVVKRDPSHRTACTLSTTAVYGSDCTPPPSSGAAFFLFVAACKTILTQLSCRRGSGTIHPTPLRSSLSLFFWGTSGRRKTRPTAHENGRAIPSTLPHLLPAECRKVRPWKEVGRRRMDGWAPGEWLKPSMPHTPSSPRLKSN